MMKGQEKLADMGVFANKTDLEIILSFFFSPSPAVLEAKFHMLCFCIYNLL